MKKIIDFIKSLFNNLEYVPTNIPMVAADVKAAEIKEKKTKKAVAKNPTDTKTVAKKTAKKSAKKSVKNKNK